MRLIAIIMHAVFERMVICCSKRHSLHEVGMLQTSAESVSTQALRPDMGARFRFFGKAVRRSIPPGWLCSSQKRGTSSQILARRHTHANKHSPALTPVTPTSIRCNHTHNAHWVHVKWTQIKQRQYKPDWRCTTS